MKLAIINAQAGMLKGLSDPQDVRSKLHGLADNLEIKVINGDNLSAVLADIKQAPPSQLIIAGGDGTVAAFWRALIGHDVTFGLIPTGSLNNIATSLGIPDDPELAVGVIDQGKILAVDAGKANGKIFFESVGAGLLADIMERIGEQDSKKEVAKTALESLKQIVQADPFKVRATIDGTMHNLETMWLTVTNSGRAAAVEIDPLSDMTDGVLEITYCKPIGLTDLPGAVNTFILNTHVTDGPFERMRGKQITLQFEQPTTVHIDGEVQTLSEVNIEVLPKVTKVFVP